MGRGFHGAWSTEGIRGILSATKDATDVGCGLGIAAWSGIFRGASQCSARGFGPGGLEVPGGRAGRAGRAGLAGWFGMSGALFNWDCHYGFPMGSHELLLSLG